MDQFRKQEIIARLTEKGATEPCPRCRNPQFELLGEASIPFEEEDRSFLKPLVPKLSAIPVIILACNKCGYITYHAEGILNPKTSFLGSFGYNR
jgi:predicted nucleic-acid-binding Zn-ribbon protein